ncbi:MAG: efflux RND transporter periplasmic adaptor subunit [Methylotenera sp.]
MQNGKVVPGVLLAILLAGGGWYWNHSKANIQSNAQEPHELDPNRKPGSDRKRGGSGNGVNRPVPVLAASVTTGDIRVVQTALGTVTPSAVVAVSSRVNGQLTRILFKEGQLVRAGELLAEIDPRPFQAALSQVQGQAMRNQALLRNSQIDLERYKTLQAQDSIASQQVDAQASLVQQYQGTVQADQGLVDNAKLQLSFTRITSPINGRIGLRQVDMGNNITTANTLAVVNTVDPIHVVFTLPEDRVSDLVTRFQSARKSGNNLLVEAWDRGNSNLLAKGNLLSLDNQIDTASGTVKLKARFSNKDSALFPNQFVNVRLLSNTLHNVTIVPNAAIQHGSAGAFVYRITHKQKDTTQKDAAKDAGGNTAPDTRVSVQAVRLGTVDGDDVEVIDGLKADDQVVISGVDKLKENAKVIISRPEAKSEKAGNDSRQKTERGLKHRNHVQTVNQLEKPETVIQ